ncbi:hypothetical protein K440DRAFT_391665 [Wilcoxina mikolae CBS 423.85]|nr:hypothetical protein K440DRAFT_391665 [Wilcoxina mikolae CBS 423.85]
MKNDGDHAQPTLFLAPSPAQLTTYPTSLFKSPQPKPTMSTPTTISVKAVYASPLPAPSDSKTFTVPTETPSTTEASTQAEQTAHVKAVREAVGKLQDEVNAYLTERMEEEKALGVTREKEVEEERYGEEAAEEDE